MLVLYFKTCLFRKKLAHITYFARKIRVFQGTKVIVGIFFWCFLTNTYAAPIVGGVAGHATREISEHAVTDALRSKGRSMDDLFKELFARGIPKMRATLPVMVDDGTLLYDVSGKNREWNYWYRMLEYKASDIPALKFKKELAPLVTKKVCSTPSMMGMLKIGGSYRYNYADKDMRPIMSIAINSTDCGL